VMKQKADALPAFVNRISEKRAFHIMIFIFLLFL